MKHFPKLSSGTRRVAGVGGAQFGRGITATQFELPVYGRYCGPGFGDGGNGCIAPIDEVDAVCCRHDACYEQSGSHDCGCELRLLSEINTAIAQEAARGNAAAVSAGLVVREVFRVKPCVCSEICIPGIGCIPLIAPTPFVCPFA